MKINSFRWLAAAIVLTASGTVSTASPVPVVVDYENVVNSDTTVTAVGISWTLTGDLGDVLIDGYGAPAAGTASPGSNGYMDTGLGVSHPLGNLGGLKAPTGATFRAASFDVWPSQDSGDNIYGGSGNVLGTTGLNYELVGLKGGHQVVSATVTDTPRTPPQSGPATGYWHHIDLSATAFATADIDTIEFVLVAQTGAAMNYLAVDNVAYFDYAAPAAAPQVTWTPPPPIIYGAALTTNQLNASAMVAGSVAYLPDVGTVLNTGSNTLTAIFTPADLLDYRLVTNTVVQTVLPAVLTVKANNASRAFGQANPAFTGTITGVTNGDNITASYGTPATPGTPVGTHPIVPGLVDPANRQTNYTVTLIDGTLTINAVETPSLVVTMTNDVVDPYDNQTSLREALAYAQTLGRTPTITFSNTLAGQTVILTNIGDGTFGPSALLVSNVAVVIDGGTNAVTLSQGIGTNSLTGGMRIFYVAASGNLTLKNLTVSGGLAQGGGCDYGGGAAGLGGAVVNAGTLQLVQCTFTANQALGGNCNSNNIDALDAGGGLGGNGDASSGDGGPPNGGLGLGGNGGFGGGGGMLGGFGGFGGGGGGGGLGGLGGFGAGSGSDLGGGGFGGGGGGGFGGAGLGGAVFNYGGAVAVANATLAGNVARGGLGVSNGSGYGGAIFNLNGSVTALNATIVGNTAPQGGGAIYNLGDNGVATQAGPVLPSAPASVTLTNTILAGSSDGSARPVSDYLQYTNNSGNGGGFGSVTSGGANNLIVSNAVNQAFAGGILSSANPLLGPLASNGGPTPTMALLPGSPAITAGSLTAVAGLPTDQRGAGYPRVVNGQVGLGAYEIQTVPAVITWTNPAAIVYGTALSASQLNATPNVAGTFAYEPANGTVLTTGTNLLTVIFTPADATYYTGATNQVELVVLPAPLTVTAADASRVYDQFNPPFNGTLVGLTNGDVISAAYASGALTNTPAGIYRNAIVPTLVDPANLATNYAVTLVAGTLTITPAPTVISWTNPANPAAIVYGTALGANQLNATANVAGAFTYIPAAGTVLTTGVKTLTSIFTPTDTTDYTGFTNQVSLVVLPAPLTVTAANASRYYNTPNPVFSGAIVGLTNGDIITATYASGTLTNTPAGIYSNSLVPTLVDPNHLATNYSVTLVAGALTVLPATPVITWTYPANPAPIVYGAALGTSQLNATANVAGTFTYVPAAGTVLTTGTKTLASIFTPTDTADYSVTTNQVSLVVLPAPLTVTAANASRYYNTPNPVFTGAIMGLTNGDVITVTCTSSALTNTPAGVYSNSIVPTLIDPNNLATNYSITLVAGTLTVFLTTPVISWTNPANPAAIVYGTALSTNQLNATANVAGSFTYIPAAGTVLTTGTKTLTDIFTPADTTDYSVTTNQFSLVVLPAPLTVTAANASRYYPTTNNPVFSGTIVGLTNGDVITATYASSALPNTPAGVYGNSIVPTLVDPHNLATNYAVTLVAGALTILKASLIITWTNPAVIAYAVPLDTNQLNATANVPGSFAYIPPGGTVLPVGTNTLTTMFTPADKADYNDATSQVSQVVVRLGISAAPVTLDFLTGLYEQSVQVTNPGATLGGIELLVSNLTSRVSLYNAAGTNAGLPYAQFAVALPTGASQTFILQFLNPYRTNITDAVYCIAIVPPPPRLNGTTGLLITQVKINTVVAGSPRFTLAFPSTAGQSYEVLYSDDNLSSWRVADTLTATSTFTIWTELLPPAAICRFFKVIITPSPN